MRRIGVLLAIASLVGSGCGLVGGSEGHQVVAYFEDVGDLVDRATVQVNDVEIGQVTGIDLVLDDGEMVARVTMSVDEEERISTEGLTALIRQTSLLGEQFVELLPASDEPPYLGSQEFVIDVSDTDRRVSIETFLGDLSAFVGGAGLEDLNQFTHAQALILEDRGRRFGESIHELELFTRVLSARRFDIADAIDSLANAGETFVSNQATLDRFLDSLDEANVLLADQGDELRRLFSSLRRFGTVSSRFLARHEEAIDRQFMALRPVFRALASAEGELRVDIQRLATFFELFPKSLGGGGGGNGKGDYVQADAILCEILSRCHTEGEKGDVKGEGS